MAVHPARRLDELPQPLRSGPGIGRRLESALDQRQPCEVEGNTFLCVKVDDIDRVAKAMEGWPVAVPRKKTFYGATEIGYRDPAGHWIVFAQMED